MLLPEPCPVKMSGCRAEIKDRRVGGSVTYVLQAGPCWSHGLGSVPAQDAACPGSSHTNITLSLPAHTDSGAALRALLTSFSFGMKDTELLSDQNQPVSEGKSGLKFPSTLEPYHTDSEDLCSLLIPLVILTRIKNNFMLGTWDQGVLQDLQDS